MVDHLESVSFSIKSNSVFSHLKVPEVGERGVFGEGSGHGELDLLCVDVESVADVDSHLGGDAADQPVDLALKVHLVVDDVDIRMSWVRNSIKTFAEGMTLKFRLRPINSDRILRNSSSM